MEKKRDILIKPYKILIVDDDPLVVKTLERLLFKKNFLFHSVSSGEKALEVIQDITPDIILLDVMMSDIDGYEVCQNLKKQPFSKNIPVIFLTSNTEIDDVIKGFQAGAVDYIVKPFNSAELIARLETHLELKRSREEIKLMDLIKTKFFSIMTNDIQNSLIGLKGVANFLHQELSEKNIDPNEPLKLSKILLNDSSELYDLLENLIEWASIELGLKEPNIQTVKVDAFIQENIDFFEDLLQNKNLKTAITGDAQQEIVIAKGHLESILHRLISNAIKYSQTGGFITIDFKKKEDQNIFTIADEGIGMSQEVVENVFRLDTPHPKTIGTYQEKGTGLGLIICKTLADSLQGNIIIESQKNKGSKVIVAIPEIKEIINI